MTRAFQSLVMLFSFLFLLASANSSELHHFFHADSDSGNHECAITWLCHGKVDAAEGVYVLHFLPPVAPSLVFFNSQPPVTVPTGLSHSRAPPV